MNTRYTAKSFQEDLVSLNLTLAMAGAVSFVAYGGRNGYTAADEVYIGSDGVERCMRNITCGTPREALDKARHFMYCASTELKVSRKQAKGIAQLVGVDFSKDYHEIPVSQVDVLRTLAKASGYRKPTNANGSLTRYFFKHLDTRVSIG